MSYVESVVFRAEDDQCPPEHVLMITGHPGTEHSPGDEFSITLSAYDETSPILSGSLLAIWPDAADGAGGSS